MKKIKALLLFLMFALLGYGIWLISILYFQSEPWDSLLPIYYLTLFIIGIVAGLCLKHRLLIVYLGVIAGQIIYIVNSIGGPYVLSGLLYTPVYALLIPLGYIISTEIKIRFRKR